MSNILSLKTKRTSMLLCIFHILETHLRINNLRMNLAAALLKRESSNKYIRLRVGEPCLHKYIYYSFFMFKKICSIF